MRHKIQNDVDTSVVGQRQQQRGDFLLLSLKVDGLRVKEERIRFDDWKFLASVVVMQLLKKVFVKFLQFVKNHLQFVVVLANEVVARQESHPVDVEVVLR